MQNTQPQHNGKQHRDAMLFPQGLPSNTPYPVYDGNKTYIDRQSINSRKGGDGNVPVQNQYLQNYQFHQFQQKQECRQTVEQARIDNIMNKKPLTGEKHLERNNDDAQLLLPQMPNFFDNIPQDTRRQRFNIDTQRVGLSRSMPFGTNMGQLPYRER